MKSFQELSYLYKTFRDWQNATVSCFKTSPDFIPYKLKEGKLNDKIPFWQILAVAKRILLKSKEKLDNDYSTSPNRFQVIETEIENIYSKISNNTYTCLHNNQEISYDLDILRLDITEGVINIDDNRLILVSYFFALEEFWNYIHLKNPIYNQLRTTILNHKFPSNLRFPANKNISENIKDRIMIELIILNNNSSHRTIIKQLKLYRDTLSSIDQEFYTEEILETLNTVNEASLISEDVCKKIESTFSQKNVNTLLPKSRINISYQWLLTENQLNELYYKLIENGFIDKETTQSNFKKAFSQSPLIDLIIIRWTSSSALLTYFIDNLHEQGFIKREQYVWKIASSCFSNAKNLKQKKDQYLNSKSGSPRSSQIIDTILNSFTIT